MTASVALVLDSEFGDQLSDLAKEMPVWVLASSTNTKAIETIPATVRAGRVTTILARPNEEMEDLLLRAAYAIDEHHGEVSQSTPYQALWVYGASIAPPELISELGFKLISPMSWGLKAEK